MSQSKILFSLCLSFVAGIFLESIIKIPPFFLWGFLFLGIILIFTSFLTKKLNVIVGFSILFLAIGILWVQISEFNIANDKLSKFNGKGKIIVTGIIFDEPDVRDTSQKIKVKVSDSLVLVTTKRYPEYEYLDKVKFTGELETPMVTDDFNYKNYLLKDRIYSVMNFPKVELISQKHQYNIFSYLYEKILFLKQKLYQSIQEISLPPHSLILQGIILGNNKNMTQSLRNDLSNSGLRFLTAISGVHVIILSAILVSFLMFFGLGRIYASSFSLIFVWLYIVITGFSASGIRAAIMGSIFIFAGVLGRQNTSSRTIVLAAALMLLQNPLLLIYDIGFQLSFMASLGIIYLKPLFDQLFKKIFKEKLKEFFDILSATFSAQIFILPLIVYNFGTISLSAPITSILILPMMPWILSFGFIFSGAGILSKLLGQILYIPCWVLITYFLKIMEFFSQPWMAKSITGVSWIWLVVCYLALGVLIWILRKKYLQDFY